MGRTLAQAGGKSPGQVTVSTVQGYFYDWRDRGFWQSINHLLVNRAAALNEWRQLGVA